MFYIREVEMTALEQSLIRPWMPCRTPEEETAQLDAQAEIAPHIQDDFDIAEDALQTLDVKDNPEFQVSTVASASEGMHLQFECSWNPLAFPPLTCLFAGEAQEADRECKDQD